MVSKLGLKLFPVVFDVFQFLLLVPSYSLALLNPLFPGVPELSVVIYQEYATLLLAREIVDEYAKGQSEWNEKRIHDRLQTLMKDALIIWPNFASEFPQSHYDEENDRVVAGEDLLSVDDFTDEAFQDPLRLIDEMESLASGGQASATPSDIAPDVSGMLNRDEFIRKVSVHAKTVRRYIRIGEIVPDAVIQVSAHRTNDYYLPQSVIRYAEKYGWQLIDEGNLLPAFIDMIERMTMSYSYKPMESLIKEHESQIYSHN